MMDFTNKSAFWVFNQVTNFAYTRYNEIHPEIKMKQDELENKYIAFTKIIDLAAKEMFKQDKASAIEFLTDFSCNQGDNLTNEWRDFYGYLFAKYMDGNIKTKVEGQMNPKVVQKPYSEEYRRNIVKSAGDKLEVKGAGH
jgi:dipeptidase